MIEFPYSIAGFVVGAIVGLTGVGGGSLMTPLLVLVFGVAPVTAVGTDLLYAGLTKAGGVASHGLKGHIDWRVTGLLAVGSIPATLLALSLLSVLPPASPSTKLVVSTALGVMLVLTALALVFRARLLAWAASHSQSSWIAKHRTFATVATGAFIGFAVTFSSRIVGSDIAHAVPITLIAGLGHAFLGNVNWWLLASLLIGSLPGILVGSHLAARIPERVLRHSLVAVLLLAGTKLVIH